MTDKDVTEKILEDYNDVFADILNVLLFNGKEMVNPDDLIPQTTNSYYKINRKIKGQDRDVAKLWNNMFVHIASFGFENQTVLERDMPLRIIGYDGASYRNQLTKENKNKPNYPIVTLVLYFGLKRWNKYKSLKECFDIPEWLENYVSDYRINVFEIAYLTEEQVKMFKSDFRLIADYFVQMRTKGEYKPITENIKHVWETLNLMSVLTDDIRFEEVYESLNRKEPINMCTVIDNYIEKGMEKGMKKGMEKGRIIATIDMCREFGVSVTDTVKRLVRDFALSEQEAEIKVKERWSL